MKIKAILKLMRVHHYIKNILVFVPLVFVQELFNISYFKSTALGFLAFCAMSSAVYIINDSWDAPGDKLHPVKCKRPIASGQVSIGVAYTLCLALVALALGLNFFAQGTSATYWVLGAYLLVNIFYTLKLKEIPLIDVVVLVAGYFLRVLYGGLITGIPISNWLFLTVISMSFYLGFGKRRNEIIKQGDDSRPVLKHYTKDFLDKNMYTCLSLTIMFYALWTIDPATVAKVQNMIWTVPLVMLVCMRYSLIIESGGHGDPVEVILKDKLLLALGMLLAGSYLFLIYFNGR